MPAIDDLAAIRQLLDVPPPPDDVTAVGRARLDQLIRHDASRRPGRTGRGFPRRRVGMLAAATGALAAAAAVATALALAHPVSRPDAATQPTTARGTGPTAPGDVRKAILTAVGSAGGDVMHLTVSTSGGPGFDRGVVQYWWWPARPARGQQVHLAVTGPSARVVVTFAEPAVNLSDPRQRMLPASGFAVFPAAKAWEPVTQWSFEGVFPGTTAYLLNENYLRKTYLPQSTVITDNATVDGRRAIETSLLGPSGLRVLIWIDARTYLPLRQLKLDPGTTYPQIRQVFDYQFLPPTPANLAALSEAVPPGYRRQQP